MMVAVGPTGCIDAFIYRTGMPDEDGFAVSGGELRGGSCPHRGPRNDDRALTQAPSHCKVRHAAMSVMIKPVYLRSYFRIPSDEALLADPSAILQGEVHSPIGIDFCFALAAPFFASLSHCCE